MQTFHVFADFGKTARALDDRRLGKQRIETMQTLNQITTGSGGYPHHPINKMWEGYEFAMVCYGMIMCMEWAITRHCVDNQFWEFSKVAHELKDSDPATWTYEQPPWLRDQDLMRTHRSNLIRKQHEGAVAGRDYEAMFPKTPLLLPYLWPVVDGHGGYDLRISKADKKRLVDGERVLPESMAERVVNL